MPNSSKRSISLGVRLIAFTIIVVTMILACIGAFQYARTKTLYTKLVDEGLHAATIRLSGNLGSPLWNFNKEQTAEVLKSEMAQDALVAITVHMGTDKKVFAGARKLPSGSVETVDDERQLPQKLFTRSFEVPWEGNTIATGTVYYSLDSLRQTLRAQVTSTLIQALVTDLVLIILIGLVLSNVVVRPLGQLTGIANSLVSGNFSSSVVESAISSLKDIAKKLNRDELGALTHTFDDMLVNLRARDTELEGHRQNLERLVGERTQALTKRNEEMRLVLDNVDQGLVLVALDGTLSDERSAAFTQFFGDSERNAAACIFQDTKARAFFRLGYEQIADNFMPIDVVLEQLPKTARRGSSVFGLHYQPLMDGEDCKSVLFMINDITHELAAQEKDREQYEQIRVFERWMRDRNGFIEFFNEVTRMVKQLREEKYSSPEERLRIIHTIKGNTSLFDVLSVAEVAHLLESSLIEQDAEASKQHWESLLSAWDVFAKRVSMLIGDFSERLELTRPELDEIISGLKRGQPTNEIVRRLVAITYEPMKLRFSRIEQQLKYLAERLHKAPVECVTHGDELRLPLDQLAPFWGAFPHVVRNIADHGFETQEERKDRCKPAHNRVTLHAIVDSRSIEIGIADDGRGIDWEHVAERARELGMPHSLRRDLVAALFSPGFSTSQQVSSVSGRGVGLSAIEVEVSKLNGLVTLESEPGQGTKFKFKFPLEPASDGRLSVAPRISVPPPGA